MCSLFCQHKIYNTFNYSFPCHKMHRFCKWCASDNTVVSLATLTGFQNNAFHVWNKHWFVQSGRGKNKNKIRKRKRKKKKSKKRKKKSLMRERVGSWKDCKSTFHHLVIYVIWTLKSSNLKKNTSETVKFFLCFAWSPEKNSLYAWIQCWINVAFSFLNSANSGF